MAFYSELQVLNKLPTDRRQIKVPMDRSLCSTKDGNKKIKVCNIFFFMCIAGPDRKSSLKCLSLPVSLGYFTGIYYQFITSAANIVKNTSYNI